MFVTDLTGLLMGDASFGVYGSVLLAYWLICSVLLGYCIMCSVSCVLLELGCWCGIIL